MKIICIGRNYINHAKELNNPVPQKPVFFMKPETSLLQKNNPFFYPDFSENIHHELVNRPALPLPAIFSKSSKAMFSSFAILLTSGE